VVMRNGFIQQVGPPMEVYNQPVNQFVAGFIGSPPMNFLDGRLVEDKGELQVDLNGLRLSLPPDKAKQAEAYVNKNVVFGVRPEDILPSTEANGKQLASLRANVEVLEPLGSEIILELSTRGYNFTARMDPQLRVKMHDEIQIHFDMSRSHLFDRQTEQAIV
jgi:multiple sugar transport system ATP-binding protein